MTLQLVETVTLTSSASSIEFTSIPQDGVDLLLKLSVRTAAITNNLRFNNSTASEYTTRFLFGDGSGVGSVASFVLGSFGNIYYTTTSETANTFTNGEFYISNYTSSAAKSVSFDNVTENNATTAYQQIWAGLWNNTSAITSVKLLFQTAQVGTTASLYKIS